MLSNKENKLIFYLQEKNEGATSWIVLPMRWVVERTFAWINTCRRLSKDYELSIVSAENFIRLAFISIIIKRF